MTLESVDIIKALLDLGFSAILIYFLFIIWKDRKETITEKDSHIRSLNSEVLDVVKDNTRTQESLRQTVAASTRATETLTSRIFEMINSKN